LQTPLQAPQEMRMHRSLLSLSILAGGLLAGQALAEEPMLWLRCEGTPSASPSALTVQATWRIGPESMVVFSGDPLDAGDEFCADRGGITSWCTVGDGEISYEASRGDERWDYVINRRTGRATLTHAKGGRRTTATGTCAPIDDPLPKVAF
jgi:hypothetical protein